MILAVLYMYIVSQAIPIILCMNIEMCMSLFYTEVLLLMLKGVYTLMLFPIILQAWYSV